ncbi:MAG: pentapeptide repeat-containing protein [Myxococcales bacterium]|nr:pentapeptide repeat-containing protein [Myxococcales bacterium]
MEASELKAVLDAHALWLQGKGGERANLRSADLQGANLQGANLRHANLQDANLQGANLRSAGLYGADLRSASLQGANLQGANLRSAGLYGADLQGANLRSADLRSADLRSADLRSADLRSADLRGTGILRVYVQGYEATAYPDGRAVFGCESHTFEEWEGLHHTLAQRWAPGDVEKMAEVTRAFVELAKATRELAEGWTEE